MNHLSTLMKTKIWYYLFVASVVIAVAFFVRQRTLTELRASNQSLRQQLDAQASSPPAAPLPTAEPPAGQLTNPVVALTQDERTELIRLRGQFLPLRDELLEKSNRVVKLTQPTPRRVPKQSGPMSSESQTNRQADVAAMNAFMRTEPYRNARILNMALKEYVESHAGELPDDLAQLEAFARRPLPAGFSQQFELMRSGTVPEEARSYTFIARQKEPQQRADGKWVRIYLKADGSTSTIESVNKPNWPSLERSHEAIVKQMTQRKQQKTQP